MTYHDVTVLGAGWSGLIAIKYMKEEGLTVVALERRDGIGGLWYYSDDPKEKTVMKSTRTTSSSSFTELSDYPYPDNMGEFPHHSQVLDYLKSYCENFDLFRHIRFNTTVEKVEKKGDLWYTYTSTGITFTSKFLIVCTGEPVADDPRDSVFANFTGCVYHAQEIKEPLEEHRNSRLLVYGGGETAADICQEWFDHVNLIYWSAPRGQSFFRRYGKAFPWNTPAAYDQVSSYALQCISPWWKSKPGFQWMCRWTTAGSLLAYHGHGIPEWNHDAANMHYFINKNGHVLDLIDYKKFVPKGAIESCNGKEVIFADGSKQEFDVVIVSTGYRTAFDYLPEQFTQKTFRQRYKHVMDNDDPTLSFIGFIRPVLASMPALAEIQSRWVAKVYSGKLELKSKEERLKVTKADGDYWIEYFSPGSQRLDRIVEGMIYYWDMVKLAEVYPSFTRLFKKSIYHWYVALVAPFNPGYTRLNEPEHEDKVIATMDKHRRKAAITDFILLIVFVSRMIWLEWWLTQLDKIKYKIQTSKYWPPVRDSRPVRIADWVWCIPKRLTYDNKTPLPDYNF